MGVAHWDPAVEIEPETVTVRFDEGWPVALDGRRVRRPRRARARGERDRRPARARHVRPDREPDHRGEVPRHLRGAGHGAPLLAYERLVNAIHNEATIDNYRTMRPAARAPALRGPLVRPAVADAAAEPAGWIGIAVTGEVTIELRRGDDYTVLDTVPENATYHPDAALDGERRERRSARSTGSGSSRCACSTSRTRAASSRSTAGSASRAARARSSARAPRSDDG